MELGKKYTNFEANGEVWNKLKNKLNSQIVLQIEAQVRKIADKKVSTQVHRHMYSQIKELVEWH